MLSNRFASLADPALIITLRVCDCEVEIIIDIILSFFSELKYEKNVRVTNFLPIIRTWSIKKRHDLTSGFELTLSETCCKHDSKFEPNAGRNDIAYVIGKEEFHYSYIRSYFCQLTIFSHFRVNVEF